MPDKILTKRYFQQHNTIATARLIEKCVERLFYRTSLLLLGPPFLFIIIGGWKKKSCHLSETIFLLFFCRRRADNGERDDGLKNTKHTNQEKLAQKVFSLPSLVKAPIESSFVAFQSV